MTSKTLTSKTFTSMLLPARLRHRPLEPRDEPSADRDRRDSGAGDGLVPGRDGGPHGHARRDLHLGLHARRTPRICARQRAVARALSVRRPCDRLAGARGSRDAGLRRGGGDDRAARPARVIPGPARGRPVPHHSYRRACRPSLAARRHPAQPDRRAPAVRTASRAARAANGRRRVEQVDGERPGRRRDRRSASLPRPGRQGRRRYRRVARHRRRHCPRAGGQRRRRGCRRPGRGSAERGHRQHPPGRGSG